MTGVDELIDIVHEGVWARSELLGPLSDLSIDDLEGQIQELLLSVEPLASAAVATRVVDEVRARIDGLGPLHELAAEPSITELMVNGDGWVWVEQAGRLERTDLHLEPDTALHLVRRLASRAGRTIDLRHPSVDVRLLDGSRLHAIIPPLAVDGPCITIRRFSARAIGLDELASPEAARLLRQAVTNARTIVIAGGTSTGKTTLLNALAAGLHEDTRVITIEDAAELRLLGRHIIRLETRRATEATPEVSLRELARHALRMRPDRIICGEMRGAEALDLIQAMNTGHDGSMSTVHANTPTDALRRIETMMLLGEADLPLRAVREQISSCIDLVVMMGRRPDGARCVTEIASAELAGSGDWLPEREYLIADAVGVS